MILRRLPTDAEAIVEAFETMKVSVVEIDEAVIQETEAAPDLLGRKPRLL